LSIPAELSAENAVLEAGRVLEVNVQLAVCAVIGDCDTGANGCHEAVKDDCKARMEINVSAVKLSKSVEPTDVVRSVDMKDPTEPCGQPVPPYAMELMVTSLGSGSAELELAAGADDVTVTPSCGSAGGAARAAAAKAITERIASMLAI